MPDKCDAVIGGNQCGFNAEWLIDTGDEQYETCGKHVGIVMDEHDIDRAEIEKI